MYYSSSSTIPDNTGTNSDPGSSISRTQAQSAGIGIYHWNGKNGRYATDALGERLLPPWILNQVIARDVVPALQHRAEDRVAHIVSIMK